MIRRFHLYPGDEVVFPYNKIPNEYGGKKFEYKVRGARTDGDMFPARISIVKGRVKSICSICLKKMGETDWRARSHSIHGVKPYIYIGFVIDTCWIPKWGYEAKICPACALEYFGDHLVYPCSVGKDFCDEIWNYVVFDAPQPDVPYEKKTFREYVEEQFTVHRSGGTQ